MTNNSVNPSLIPWAKPDFWGKEKEYVLQALSSTWISGGPFVDQLEKDFASYQESKFALSASNGSTALQMAFLALGLKAGDEVIVPAFGFMAAANIASLMGAKPVFTDVDPKTWCMTAADIERCVTGRTKIIVAIHTYGNVCPMDDIMELARQKSIPVVEDAAESFACRYKGKLSGSFGTLGSFSFQATKTITTGEGGMIVTDREDLFDSMALYRSHGLKRKKHYWHELAGHNFRLTNMQAALGCAQFEKLDVIIRERQRVHEQYKKQLDNIDGISLQHFSSDVEPVLWAMAVKLGKKAYPQGRDILLEQMYKANIETRPGFYTAFSMKHLHQSPCLPISEELSAQIISVPTYPTLTNAEIGLICKTLMGFRR